MVKFSCPKCNNKIYIFSSDLTHTIEIQNGENVKCNKCRSEFEITIKEKDAKNEI